MKSKSSDRIAVLVTTEHRGVFFGYLPADADRFAKSLTLNDCRNAIYWAGKRGFLGLAAHGPDPGSKIGSRAREVLLHSVTSVSLVTDEAAKAWEAYDA